MRGFKIRIIPVIIYTSLRVYNYATRLSHRIKLKRKVEKLILSSGAKKLTKDQKKSISTYYNNLGITKVSTDWHRLYSDTHNKFFVEYVPEDLFYLEIHQQLNRSLFAEALVDKNLLSTLFRDIAQPECILKNSNGYYYDTNDRMITAKKALELCEEGHKLIVKPTIETGGGKNVILFTNNNGVTDHKNFTLQELFASYKMDFIVQKAVEQHPGMALLNSSSLNTFRVMSYLGADTVVILSIVVRMGREGTITDNSTAGGISCGVNSDGTLNYTGKNINGESFTTTDGGIPFRNINLPFINKVYDAVLKIHKKVPYFKLISWDLAIDQNSEVVLIEYNVKGQDINIHQLNNGPVFKPVLPDIIKKCL